MSTFRLFAPLAIVAVAGCPSDRSPPAGEADLRASLDASPGGDAAQPLALSVVSPQNPPARAGDLVTCTVKATRGASPASGVTVGFLVAAGRGRVKSATVTTGADGLASTSWQLGFTGRGQALQASAPGAAPVSCLADAAARPLAFQPMTSIPAGTRPSAMSFAHLDDDDLPDLVVSFNDGNVGVAKNAGNGNFSAFRPWKTAAGSEGLAVCDFNKDGYDDVAVANNLAKSVSVFTGAAPDLLIPVSNYPTDAGPFDVACADFNGDGKRDLAVSARAADAITFLRGNGDGTFTAEMPSLGTGNAPTGLAVGDLNGDAGEEVGGEFPRPDLLDLVVAQSEVAKGGSNHTVRVFTGGANFVFGIFQDYPLSSKAPVSVVLGDLDGDGKTDAAVGDTGSPNGVSVLIGNGNGGFAMPAHNSLSNAPGRLALGDADGNGAPDVIVPLGGAAHKLTILLNDGHAQLAPQDLGTDTHIPTAALIRDINDDGLPDILATADSKVLLFIRQ